MPRCPYCHEQYEATYAGDFYCAACKGVQARSGYHSWEKDIEASARKVCPRCQGPLKEVLYPVGSMLNREQFDAVRAGDYYCESCKGDQAKSGYLYFWKAEIPVTTAELLPTPVKIELPQAPAPLSKYERLRQLLAPLLRQEELEKVHRILLDE